MGGVVPDTQKLTGHHVPKRAATENNVRLVVKNTGHDFQGRSTAPGALSIWVHHIKGTKVSEDPFKPKGCDGVEIEGPSINIKGGSQMTEIYSASDAMGYVPIGANGRSVAIGGFITGGGHSIISPTYGLAADHVLEMEIVSAQGELLTLNECQNTDLFWAIRGGGASTFGIVTEVTMTIFPTPSVASMDFYYVTSALYPQALDGIGYLMSQFPMLADEGISGYPLIVKDASLIPGLSVTGILGKLVKLNAASTDELLEPLQPIFEHMNATWPGAFAFEVTSSRMFDRFQPWYDENYDRSAVGFNHFLASRLMDRESMEKDTNKTGEAFGRFANGDQNTVFIVSGKGVHEAKPRGGGNAVVPAWRKAYVHASKYFRLSSFLHSSQSSTSSCPPLRGETLPFIAEFVLPHCA